MLALCPKLFLGENKKKLIQENYAVNEPISEEIDSESITPRNWKINFKKNNFLKKCQTKSNQF